MVLRERIELGRTNRLALILLPIFDEPSIAVYEPRAKADLALISFAQRMSRPSSTPAFSAVSRT